MRPPEPFEGTLPEPGEVHLWWGRVPRTEEEGDLSGPEALLLSEDERARAQRFLAPLLRRRFVHRRALLRRILGAALGRDPSALRFEEGEHHKPRLASGATPDPGGTGGPGGRPGGLTFNLSHTGDWVLIGLARGAELGVDVETLERRGSLEGVAQRVFTDRELAALGRLAAGGPWEAAFLRGWARKEALLKALGTGLLRDPRGVHVGLEERAGGASWPPDDPTLAGWGRLADLDAPPGHAAAACLAGELRRWVVRLGWQALGDPLGGVFS